MLLQFAALAIRLAAVADFCDGGDLDASELEEGIAYCVGNVLSGAEDAAIEERAEERRFACREADELPASDECGQW